MFAVFLCWRLCDCSGGPRSWHRVDDAVDHDFCPLETAVIIATVKFDVGGRVAVRMSEGSVDGRD